jgi:hypothetical protein
MNSAKTIQVIETQCSRGAGVAEDPCRTVTEYWAPDGTKLAERDAWADEQLDGLRYAAYRYTEAVKKAVGGIDTPEARELDAAMRRAYNLKK